MKPRSLAALVVALTLALPAVGFAQMIRGGGEGLIAGGFGFPPRPVKNVFAFTIERDAEGNVTGNFECLALMPSAGSGTGSGLFTDNLMYVTGQITALHSVDDKKVSFSGKATVTGLGAGTDLIFDCDVSTGEVSAEENGGSVGIVPGGPGAYMTLSVSGLDFKQILTSGQIVIEKERKTPPRAIR